MSRITELPKDLRIVAVGHVCIDENSSTDESGSRAAQQRVAGSSAFFMHRHWRSDAANRVAIVAPYGEDFLEVDATLPLLNPADTGRTLLYRNHIDGEIRRQECFNAERAGAVSIGPEISTQLERSNLLVVCPLLANFDPNYIAALVAPVTGLKVLLAQGYFRAVESDGRVAQRSFEEYARVVPQFDLVVLSDEDTDDALPLARRWSLEFPRTVVVVTQNRHGATYFLNGTSEQVAATPLTRSGSGSGSGSGNVIGAGDVFSAALATRFLESRDIRHAVEHANRVAAEFIDASRVPSTTRSLTSPD